MAAKRKFVWSERDNRLLRQMGIAAVELGPRCCTHQRRRQNSSRPSRNQLGRLVDWHESDTRMAARRANSV